VTSRDNTIESVNAAMDKLRKENDKAIAEAKAKLKAAEDARDAAVADLEKERTAYNKNFEGLKAEKEQLIADKAAKNKETDALKADFQAQLAKAQGQVDAATKDVGRIKDELKKYYHLDPSTSGGAVTWVNQRENVAYLNLGWDDGL